MSEATIQPALRRLSSTASSTRSSTSKMQCEKTERSMAALEALGASASLNARTCSRRRCSVPG
eukprot:7390713-Prymnesium_polylepis.1